MRKAKNYYCIGAILFVLFILFTLLVKYVDVAAIGPQGSMVGLASINGPISLKLPFNSIFYDASKYLGYVGIATCGIFGMFGIMQLFFKKSLLKVDKDIIFLGVFYVVMLITYIVFEKVIINYRPVIMDEGLEASYPSSHTMLAVGFITVAIAQFKVRLRNSVARTIVNIALAIVMVLMVVSRVLSGVHWMTDIVGGILIAEAWAMIYCGIFAQITAKKKKKKHTSNAAKQPTVNKPHTEHKAKPVEKVEEKPEKSKAKDEFIFDLDVSDKKSQSDKPAVKKPQSDKPVAKKPQGDKLVAKKPQSDKPAAKKPQGDKPAAKKPQGDKSAEKKLQQIDIN